MNILRRLFGRKRRKPHGFTVSELMIAKRLERVPWVRYGLDFMIEEKRREEEETK